MLLRRDGENKSNNKVFFPNFICHWIFSWRINKIWFVCLRFRLWRRIHVTRYGFCISIWQYQLMWDANFAFKNICSCLCKNMTHIGILILWYVIFLFLCCPCPMVLKKYIFFRLMTCLSSVCYTWSLGFLFFLVHVFYCFSFLYAALVCDRQKRKQSRGFVYNI